MSRERLVVVGNSHLAALKLAWDAVPAAARPFPARFFGARRHGLDELAVDGGTLVPASDHVREQLRFTSGGDDVIAVAGRDVAVVGHAVSVVPLLRLLEGHRLPGAGAAGAAPVSRGFLAEAAVDVLTNAPGLALFGKLRAAGARAILVVPEPLPAETIREHAPYAAWWPPAAQLAALHAAYRAALDGLAARHGVTILDQPAETIVPPAYTAAAFTRGSRRLTPGFAEPHAPSEPFHMNEAYGAAVLAVLARAVAALPAAAPA